MDRYFVISVKIPKVRRYMEAVKYIHFHMNGY